MSLDAIHPELRFTARILPQGILRKIPLSIMRRLMNAAPMPKARGVSIVESKLDTPARVRIFSPLDAIRIPRPALVWIHGGGYVMGNAQQDDGLCADFARRLDMTVISVDYRLAPEHPYPAPLDDCFAALEFMFRQAGLLGIDPNRYAIGGASAGGGLAAGLVLRAFDAKLPAPRLQLLVYPMLDDRTVERQMDGKAFRMWDQQSNRIGWSAYVGADRLGRDGVADHAAAARRVDVSGLPPAWIGVGKADLFYDEDVLYADRLREAGVATELEVVEGAFHGFDRVVPNASISKRFFEAQVAALKKALA